MRVVGLGSRHLNVLVGLGNLLAMVAAGGAAGGIAGRGNLPVQAGVLMEGQTYKNINWLEPILREHRVTLPSGWGSWRNSVSSESLSKEREFQIYHTYPEGGGPEGAP